MGCYKIQKMLFIKKCYATRPPIQSIPNHYQPPFTLHSPLVFFYKILRGLSIPRAEINPAHCSQQL